MTRRISSPLVLVLSVALAATLPAQAAKPAITPEQALSRLRRHLTPEQMAADDSLSKHLMSALSVHSVGLSRGDTSVELQLENWKRDIAVDTIAPVARRGLALMLREDSVARRAKTLSARFSDYTPHVVTLTWNATDFKTHPERFRVTRGK